jgi:hypothetical protein
MWELFNNAQLWSQRPSVLVNVVDPYMSYCLDEAVAYFGNRVTDEVEKVKDKNSKSQERKRRAKLLQLLGAPDKQRFRQVGRPK